MNPIRIMPDYLLDEHIVFEGLTGRTETSKYPEEKKSTEIPLVVASERGPRTNQEELMPCLGL